MGIRFLLDKEGYPPARHKVTYVELGDCFSMIWAVEFNITAALFRENEFDINNLLGFSVANFHRLPYGL